MPIRQYEGKTWVAFLDISGFKEIMKDLPDAEHTLDKFYATIFNVTSNYNKGRNNLNDTNPIIPVGSLTVSDCAVVFIHNQDRPQDEIRDLGLLLKFIFTANRKLIDYRNGPQIMTTCALAYGFFRYKDKIEIKYVEKNCFYGRPYVRAYLDNERLEKKPGYCQVLMKDLSLPDEPRIHIPEGSKNQFPFNLLKEDDDYYHFYWMLRDLNLLPEFERKYESLSRDLYKQTKQLLYDQTKQNLPLDTRD